MTESRNSSAETDNGAIRSKFMFTEGKWMEIDHQIEHCELASEDSAICCLRGIQLKKQKM